MNDSTFMHLLAELVIANLSRNSEKIAEKKLKIDEYIREHKTDMHNYAQKADLVSRYVNESFNQKWRDEHGYLPLDENDKR